VRAYRHACGGWYVTYDDVDGNHRQPYHCVVPGYGRCYETAAIAWSVHRGDVR